MSKNKIKTSILVFIFCLIVVIDTIGQTLRDSSIGSISEIERKSFANFFEGHRTAGTGTSASTVASNNFDVNYYRCEWEIDPNIRFIKGKVSSYFTITLPTDKIVYDLSDTLYVDSVTWHGTQITFLKIGNDGIQLNFPSVLQAGIIDSVSIYYQGVPRDFNGFRPFVQSTHNGAPIIWTLSEPFGAKEWWPCKNGVNDKADSIDILITNPAIYQASSNGLLVQELIINTNKLSVWKHRYPIASYLVAVAVSNYAVLKDSVDVGGKMMNLTDYVYPENTGVFNTQRKYAKSAITLFSRLFGNYPFEKEKYGFTQFGAGGGMEHQTNTFLNSPRIELLEHETAHQWFGDKITCGSWQDIWLNEGFATYCQFLYNEFIDTVNYYPILKNFTRDITSLPNGSVYVSDTTNPSRIFSSRLSYDKGAFILHMLRWKLGDDIFFRGINRYLNDPKVKYNYARTADFKRNMELESRQDLTVFFQKWFYGEGYPNYNCKWMQNKNNWVWVQINQTTSDSSVLFYDMPVQLRFQNALRDTMITVNNQQNAESFWVNPGFLADTMFFDPNYRILAKNRLVQRIPANSSKENEIKIYPNPAPDNVNILMLNPSGSQVNIQLYNLSGQLVYKLEKALTGRDELITIPLSKLARGAYILVLSDNRNINTKRIIIK